MKRFWERQTILIIVDLLLLCIDAIYIYVWTIHIDLFGELDSHFDGLPQEYRNKYNAYRCFMT